MRRTLSARSCLRRPAAATTLALLLAVGCKSRPKSASGKPIAAPNTAEFADAITPLLSQPKLPFLRWPELGPIAQPLAAFYNTRELQLAWSNDGKPTTQATAMMEAFAHADDKGLRPDDYDSGSDHDRWAARVSALRSKDHAATAQFDVALTATTMRYLSDLHMGRVPPSHFNFEIGRDSKALDLPTFLNDQVLDASDIPTVLHALEPDSDLYRQTLDALHRYQDLARQQASASPEPLPTVTRNLSPGDHYTARAALEQRLTLEGIGSFADGNGQASSLTQADSDAVKDYQTLHGISPDGKLGPATIKSLNVPMSDRVAQLELALERWRWLPDPYINPRLLVNLPEFLLRGFSPDHAQEFTMRVIDGKAGLGKDNHDTPVFTHMMKYLVFRPYWNVPISIIKKELVGHVEANPRYLEEKNYEVLNRAGKPVTDYTAHGLEHDGYIVREKPGPTNSLGLIKFMFPNPYDIYLHSTPEKFLFDRNTRDFSHGCVRVQHPDELAVWVLQGQNNKDGEPWDLDAVNAAFNDEENNNKTVGLKTQLSVDIYYLTAFPEGDGTMGFFNDIYGYDEDLANTLQHGPPYPTAPLPPKQAPTEEGDTV